jgi:hypothetical protein
MVHANAADSVALATAPEAHGRGVMAWYMTCSEPEKCTTATWWGSLTRTAGNSPPSPRAASPGCAVRRATVVRNLSRSAECASPCSRLPQCRSDRVRRRGPGRARGVVLEAAGRPAVLSSAGRPDHRGIPGSGRRRRPRRRRSRANLQACVPGRPALCSPHCSRPTSRWTRPWSRASLALWTRRYQHRSSPSTLERHTSRSMYRSTNSRSIYA